ncbi:MAG: hypothetical protein ACREPM_18960 [Gemmatimonadaceae bacterium]
MTDDALLTPAAMRIIRRLPTLDHLEILLLLEREPARTWTPDDVAKVLFGDTRLVLQLLRDLSGRALLSQTPRPDGAPWAFRFYPPTATLRDAVANLRVAYDRRPFAVIAAVRRVSSRSIRSLADAFRVRPPSDEDDNG